MSKEYSFSVMPSVSISRSRFARKSQHKTSFNLGQIVPIYVDAVCPRGEQGFGDRNQGRPKYTLSADKGYYGDVAGFAGEQVQPDNLFAKYA